MRLPRALVGGVLAVVASSCGRLSVASGTVAGAQSRGGFRLLEWNVSDSAWLKQAAATRAVLRYADPDVVVLVQVAPAIDAAAVRRILAGLRGPADTTWFVSMGAAGVEHTVLASRDSVRPDAELTAVPYPRAGAAAARGAIPPMDTVELARTGSGLVRVNGAMIRLGGERLFLTGIHFTCCGTPDTWREYRRQAEATEIRARMRAVLESRTVDGVIAAGDMNLVSGPAPLDTLLAIGLPGSLGRMTRVNATHADGWTDWTWDGRGTPFNGGRLDNVAYSAGTLEPRFARVWDTEFLPPDTLRAHGLAASTSASIGRHRPVVVVFQWRAR